MWGYQHLIIVACGCAGFIVGGFLIDIDHSGTVLDKLKGFCGIDEGNCHRGILHQPIVMLSMASFFLMLGLGILIHYLGDYVVLG